MSVKYKITILILFIAALISCKKEDSNPAAPATTGSIAGIVTQGTDYTVLSDVNVYSTPATGFVSTDDQGSYEISSVKPGEYALTAAKVGYDTLTVTVSVSAGAKTTANFILDLYDSTGSSITGEIEGIVLNSQTLLPVTLVNITTLPVTGSLITDNQGRFTIKSVLPGSYQITAVKTGYDLTSINVAVNAGKITNAEFFLQPADTAAIPTDGKLNGTIKDALTGGVIFGAVITTDPATNVITSDTNGQYYFNSIAAGSYTIQVTKNEYISTSANVTILAGQTSTADFVLEKSTGSISGTVTDSETSAKLSGVNIQTNPAAISINTDVEGNYIIENLPIGSYSVTASLAGYENTVISIEVTSGKTSQADIILKKSSP